MTDQEPEAEEFEHIPWEQLTAADDDRRRKLLYGGAAALIVLAVVIVGLRAVRSPEPRADATVTPPVATSPPAQASVSVPPESIPTVPAASASAPSTPVAAAEPGLLSEADLMAVLPDDLTTAAALRAEWFVTDYFTADVDPSGGASVRAALPPGGSMPDFPQDEAGPGVSFVEWARTVSIEPLGNGLHRTEVLFRAIGAPESGEFRRLPVRAVAVTVQAEAGRLPVVLDLPAPIPLPAPTTARAWPAPDAEIPDEIVDEALAAAEAFGAFPAILGGSRSDGGWRLVVTAEDEAGNRWPLSLWLAEDGPVDRPPWGS
jgi:hypothetical protein